MENYVLDCIRANKKLDIDEYIGFWHQYDNSPQELYTFLGFTKEEYEQFYKDETCLDIILQRYGISSTINGISNYFSHNVSFKEILTLNHLHENGISSRQILEKLSELTRINE